MKRIFAFDFIRGIAVMLLVILHTGLHHWAAASELEAGSQQSDPMTNILVFLVTMAGVYYTILGCVNAYILTNRLDLHKNTPRQLILAGLVLGIVTYGIHFFFRIVTSADSGILFFGLKTGVFSFPDAEWLISSSTLSMIGINSFMVPLLVVALYRGNQFRNPNRVYTILGIIAVLIVGSTSFIRIWGGPLVENWIENGDHVPALLLAPFVYDNFPIFPYLGFTYFGAILGIMLARNHKPRGILLYCGIMAVFWFALGMIGLRAFGGINPSLIYSNTPNALYLDTFRQYGQLGMCFFFFFLALAIIEYISPAVNAFWVRTFRWVQRFGLISLTVYIFESVLTILLVRLIDLIPGTDGWNDSLLLVIGLGIFSMGIWLVISYFWQKVEFKGSVEWCCLWIVRQLSGKKSEKYDLSRLKPSVVENSETAKKFSSEGI